MITRQYFTFRPLKLNWTYTPRYSFDKELNTIDNLSYKEVCQLQWDNRHLAYFEYEDNFLLEVVEETLQKYSYHSKTLIKAKEFITECYPDAIIKENWDFSIPELKI